MHAMVTGTEGSGVLKKIVKREREGGHKDGQEFVEGIGVAWGGGWVLG